MAEFNDKSSLRSFGNSIHNARASIDTPTFEVGVRALNTDEIDQFTNPQSSFPIWEVNENLEDGVVDISDIQPIYKSQFEVKKLSRLNSQQESTPPSFSLKSKHLEDPIDESSVPMFK